MPPAPTIRGRARSVRHAIAGLQADHGRGDAAVRAQRQQLPAPQAQELCADRADLGLRQPDRRRSGCLRACRPRAGSSTGSRAPTPIPTSCWRRCWPDPPWPPPPAGAGRADPRQRYAEVEPSLPLSWDRAIDALAAAAILPDYLGAEFCRLYRVCRAAERDRFADRSTPSNTPRTSPRSEAQSSMPWRCSARCHFEFLLVVEQQRLVGIDHDQAPWAISDSS